MKVVAFGASNSKHSINRTLAAYAASLLPEAEVEVLDLNEFELPIFSPEREEQLGQPHHAKRFFEKIGEADAIIISFAEHNGSYTAAYKNLFDWTSRIDTKVYQNKPTLMLATSPGKAGAASVLSQAVQSAPHFAAKIVATLSVPNFYKSFDVDSNRLKDSGLLQQLQKAVHLLSEVPSQGAGVK